MLAIFVPRNFSSVSEPDLPLGFFRHWRQVSFRRYVIPTLSVKTVILVNVVLFPRVEIFRTTLFQYFYNKRVLSVSQPSVLQMRIGMNTSPEFSSMSGKSVLYFLAAANIHFTVGFISDRIYTACSSHAVI